MVQVWQSKATMVTLFSTSCDKVHVWKQLDGLCVETFAWVWFSILVFCAQSYAD